MNAPQLEIWGPPLWRIFHGLAERSGKGTGKFADEERRCWINFINSIRTCLPCPVCRKHYNEYLRTGEFEKIFLETGVQRKKALREWFWKFHNVVRARANKSIDIELTSLEEMYKEYGLQKFNEDRHIVIEQIRSGMFQMWHVRDEMMRFIRTLEELWRALL